jgi:hypothetical protein
VVATVGAVLIASGVLLGWLYFRHSKASVEAPAAQNNMNTGSNVMIQMEDNPANRHQYPAPMYGNPQNDGSSVTVAAVSLYPPMDDDHIQQYVPDGQDTQHPPRYDRTPNDVQAPSLAIAAHPNHQNQMQRSWV